MSPENPLNRSLCSLWKPSQMPGRHCEAFVIASQVLPVQLRNSCVYNALHLLGCHKSWRTEGKLWNHIFPWLICWEGKHFRQKQRPFVFLTLLCADWSYASLDSPCCCFGSRQTQHSPLWRHLEWLFSTTRILSIALYSGAFETHEFLNPLVLSHHEFCKMEGLIFPAEPYIHS